MKHVSLFLLLFFVTALVIYGISLTAPGLLVPIVYLAIAALIGGGLVPFKQKPISHTKKTDLTHRSVFFVWSLIQRQPFHRIAKMILADADVPTCRFRLGVAK